GKGIYGLPIGTSSFAREPQIRVTLRRVLGGSLSKQVERRLIDFHFRSSYAPRWLETGALGEGASELRIRMGSRGCPKRATTSTRNFAAGRGSHPRWRRQSVQWRP